MASDSKFELIKDAVVSGIIGLGLAGISKANVKKMKVARDRKDELPADSLPCVIVSGWGNKTYPGGSNLRDDIGYPVLIACIQASNQDNAAFADRITLWSEAISSLFRFQGLSSISSVWRSEMVSDATFDPRMFGKNLDVNFMVIRFISREARG